MSLSRQPRLQLRLRRRLRQRQAPVQLRVEVSLHSGANVVARDIPALLSVKRRISASLVVSTGLLASEWNFAVLQGSVA